MRVSASRTHLKVACDSVLLPSALIGVRAWCRMRPRHGRRPGLLSMAIDTQGVYRARDRPAAGDQVGRGDRSRCSPGDGLHGPSGPYPGTVVQGIGVLELEVLSRVVVCKHHPNFKCCPPP